MLYEKKEKLTDGFLRNIKIFHYLYTILIDPNETKIRIDYSHPRLKRKGTNNI
jgi:hypothetical protein